MAHVKTNEIINFYLRFLLITLTIMYKINNDFYIVWFLYIFWTISTTICSKIGCNLFQITS